MRLRCSLRQSIIGLSGLYLGRSADLYVDISPLDFGVSLFVLLKFITEAKGLGFYVVLT